METIYIMNSLPKYDNTNFDMLLPFLLALLVQILLKVDLSDWYYYGRDIICDKFNKTNIITISNKATCDSSRGMDNHKYCPIRFRAIMYFLSKNNNKTIYKLIQQDTFNFDPDGNINESIMPIYRVSQTKKFKIDDDIYGCVYSDYEKLKTYDNETYKSEIGYLEISSKLPLSKIQDWIENKTEEYKKIIKQKSCQTQSLIEIGCKAKKDKLIINKIPWASNCDFSNKFFTNKDKIVNIIDNFLDNEGLYKQRGIPYTLGFLLWGEPGCGKTGFIKSLMNKTKRHGITIKLNNQFDLSKLKQILFNEEINEEICIPLDNRIIILEDIDCMTDIVKTRFSENGSDESDTEFKRVEKISDSENESEKKENDNIKKQLSKILNKDKETPVELINNNLSYLLNILDGLEEYPGRIIVMTSNQPNKLDKALIRPGRIDHIIEFTNATIDDIKNIIIYYWNCEKKLTINQLKYLDTYLKKNNNLDKKYSHAYVVNICRSTNNFEECLIKLID